MTKQLYQKQDGFTLVEIIITIVIVSVALLGIYRFFQPAISLHANIENGLVATYLAEEGMGIVKNIRDNNVLTGQDWLAGLSNCTTGCQMDYKTKTSFEGMNHGIRPYDSLVVLSQDQEGFFTYDSGTPTLFTRKVTITPMIYYRGNTMFYADYAMRVEVRVMWEYQGNQFHRTVVGYLYRYTTP